MDRHGDVTQGLFIIYPACEYAKFEFDEHQIDRLEIVSTSSQSRDYTSILNLPTNKTIDCVNSLYITKYTLGVFIDLKMLLTQ